VAEYIVLETVREDGKVFEIRSTVDDNNCTHISKVDVTPEPVAPSKPVPDKEDAILSLLAQIAGVTDEKEITTHVHSVKEAV